MKRAGILLTLLALGIVVATASADRRVFTDAAGDSPYGPEGDMVRLTHGHDGNILVHTITSRRPWGEDACCPEIRIRVGRGKKPDFLLAGTHVLRFGTTKTVGRAGFVINGDTIRWRFRPKAINSPRSYEWRAVFGAGPRDVAPARYVRHRIR